jgi:glucosylceramidase
MKIFHFFCFPALLAVIAPALPASAASPPTLRWISSTQAQPWQEMPLAPPPQAEAARPASLVLDPHTTYQLIDGFGGCFNDLGWQALLALPQPQREAALRALFDPAGANFTLGRMPIGANDFSLKWYSFDETPGDYPMKDFSIQRDRADLIPYIKAAMKYQPGLGIWGVPWSPPTWMKTNGRYKGGNMKDDPRTLAAYALYFSKYVRAYRAAGVNVFAVMPQNEPIYNNGIYPQCDWPAALLNLFLRDYLVPRLKSDHVKVQVWLGTVDSGKVGDYVDPVLGDPVTNPSITGVGSQYEGQAAMLDTHQKYPDKKLAQTETECFNGDNTWTQALTTFERIIDDTGHFAGSYFYWNMILNESGRSTWNWRQNSLLTIDRKKDTVTFNPEFYAMKHFSATVLPGARRIAVTDGPFKNAVAFQNPSGTKVLLFENDSPQPAPAILDTGLSQVWLTVPPRSMNTITINAPPRP